MDIYTNGTIPLNDLPFYIDPPFDTHTYDLIEIVARMVITGIVSLFGIFSNGINFIVFYRQGPMTHSCTLSLTALAVSDFFYCLLTFAGSVCLYFHFYVDPKDYNWDGFEFYSRVSARPAYMFSDVTCWVTAFVTFERLVSVIFPFKVKTIFTPKRSFAVIVAIFAFTFFIWIPNTFQSIPETKDGRVQYKSTGMPQYLFDTYYYFNVILGSLVIVIVLVCNVIISWKVIFSQKFRKSAASTTTSSIQDKKSTHEEGNKDGPMNKPSTDVSYNASKEMKLVRMIIVICTLFIICYMMDIIYVFVFSASGWTRGVDYHWYSEYVMLTAITFFMTINSSCNIIIYYTMSTRYREDLQLCLHIKKHGNL